jgi:hypothetical protein
MLKKIPTKYAVYCSSKTKEDAVKKQLICGVFTTNFNNGSQKPGLLPYLGWFAKSACKLFSSRKLE